MYGFARYGYSDLTLTIDAGILFQFLFLKAAEGVKNRNGQQWLTSNPVSTSVPFSIT